MIINIKNDGLGAKRDNGPPLIEKRHTKTTVTIGNHQTTVLSGLTQELETISEGKVPLLGSIPIIGWLFRKSTKSKRKSFLIVFLTPHIVKDPQDLADIHSRKVKQREEFLKNM